MKRKELEKLPVLKAPVSMLKQVENETLIEKPYYKNKYRYEHDFYARCRKIGAILKVAFYKTEILAAGGRQPWYEVFLNRGEQDFLTYSYTEKRWRTSMMQNLYRVGDVFHNVWFPEQDGKLICKYLNSTEKPLMAIWHFQSDIREKQLLARHKRETDPWNAAMALIPPRPKDWDRWVSKVGIEQNYMFYQYQRGGAKTGYCSYCDREVPIRNPKHNAFGRCSRCRKRVQLKAFGKMGQFRTERSNVYLIQLYPGGFVIREFYADRSYHKENYRNVKPYCYEFRRAIFNAEGAPIKAFYFGIYKQRSSRWIACGNCKPSYYNAECGHIYGKTLPYLSKTVLRKTGLPEYLRIYRNIDPEHYLAVLNAVPKLEQISKANLPYLARACIRHSPYVKDILSNGNTHGNLAHLLGISKQGLSRLRKNNGEHDFLEWLQLEKSTGRSIADQTILWMCKEDIHPKQIAFIADRMHCEQVQHYLSRQMNELNLSSRRVMELWKDYLSMAARFGYDTSDPIVYRTRKLQQRHDELAVRSKKNEIAPRIREILRAYPHVEQNLQTIQSKYVFTDGQFQLQVPSRIEDILMDSWKLSHCIANSDTYWERIERRESYLLFLRKASAPYTPYYTIEVEPGGTIRQVRTCFNRQNSDIVEVRAFLKLWQRQLFKHLSQEDRQLAADSHELRIKELVQLRNNQVTIHTGDLAGRLLVDVLTEDLMEAA